MDSPLNTAVSSSPVSTSFNLRSPYQPDLDELKSINLQRTKSLVGDIPVFPSLPDYVKAHGGSHAIRKILIANNGIAAVKAMRSMKKWTYEMFGDDKAIHFVAMATPEDIKANAAYIHLADEVLHVPGGANNNNYANVRLIVDLAQACGAHAVWAGWGHASENPKLPESLAKTDIVWIGPGANAMRDLGDKIGSSLLAQSAGVPCMQWSGSDIMIDYKNEGIPKDKYDRSCVKNAQQALEVARDKVGYPLMIKASEGGGGKGIRMVQKEEDMEAAFFQVCGEVPGSPIFLMKLAPTCRHLEVQLLADVYGHAIAIFGRDCSIQRRHQKIIEEGPVVAAPPEVWERMEKCAVRLAEEVGYVGAGTVEYLFIPETCQFYFLELNPRLQVEHPVTELISGVNLPAAQLQVAMGIPLHRIWGIRRMYGEHGNGTSKIDFMNRQALGLPGHVIACRITAENPDRQFQPTSGEILELNFRSTPAVWGYFSVGAHGGVHEFSDSQFGHLFSQGETRDQARKNMVLALKELSIRGEIRTTVEYLRQILETPDFCRNRVNTNWLERVMANKQVEPEKPASHVVVILGAIWNAYTATNTALAKYMRCLEAGQLPSKDLYQDQSLTEIELIYDGIKYTIVVTKSGPNTFDIALGDWVVSADAHGLADDGVLVLLDGKKHVIYGQQYASGLRLTVDGQTCLFEEEYDPTNLRSTMQGKLVRFTIPDGTHLEKDAAYAEIEVMKMYVTLLAPEPGVLNYVAPEGSILSSGMLIATLTLDHPDLIKKAKIFEGVFPKMIGPYPLESKANVTLRESLHKLRLLLWGYRFGKGVMERLVTSMMQSLRDQRLPLLQFQEIISVLSARIPDTLFEKFQEIIQDYEADISQDRFHWESPEAFPVVEIQDAIQWQLANLPLADRQILETLFSTSGLPEFVNRYKDGNHSHCVHVLTELMDEFYAVEEHFANNLTPEHVIKRLRHFYNNDFDEVARIARAHNQLQPRSQFVVKLLKIAQEQLTPLLTDFMPMLTKLSTLRTRGHATVVLEVRQIMTSLELPSFEQRKIAVHAVMDTAAGRKGGERLARLAPLINHAQPIEDIIFQMVQKKVESKNPEIESMAMEVFIRRVYQAYRIPTLDVTKDNKTGFLTCLWSFVRKGQNPEDQGVGSPNLHAFRPMRPVSPTLNRSRDANEAPQKISSADQKPRHGCLLFCKDLRSVGSRFEAVVESFGKNYDGGNAENVLYFAFNLRSALTDDEVLSRLAKIFEQKSELLNANGIGRLTFLVFFPNRAKNRAVDYPGIFTFRPSADAHFVEDSLIRHIEPSYAQYMQLQRLSNFNIQFVPTSNRVVHVFDAQPAVPMKVRKGQYDGRRFFVRVLLRKVANVVGDAALDLAAHPEAELSLVEALHALEMSVGDDFNRWRYNHIFLSVLMTTVMSPSYMSSMLRALVEQYSQKLIRLDASQVEFSISLQADEHSVAVPYRFICSNPTGYEYIVESYKEVDDGNGKLHYELCESKYPGSKALLEAGYQDRIWNGKDVLTPYRVQEPMQKFRQAAKATDTVYVYDYLPLLNTAVQNEWKGHAEKMTVDGKTSVVIPDKFIDVVELVLPEKLAKIDQGEGGFSAWMKILFDCDAVEVVREPGQNKIGMVAWKLTLYTPSYPAGRDIVVISNDISMMAGSFGPQEDALFFLASKYSRQHKIPRLYFAANAGARIGLATEIQPKFKVAWTGDDPLRGFQYLYLTPEDFEELKDGVNCEPVEVELKDNAGKETRYVLVDVIGRRSGIGIENLSGSGLIAGETSLANQEVFTLTFLSSRCVGIGAYLARLGQRVIQKESAPLLLTGHSALNSLLGRAVYSSNNQLGGPDVMYANGVSHLTVGDDLEGMEAVINWLSFVPAKRGERAAVLPTIDPIDRNISFKPTQASYDPRHMMAGYSQPPAPTATPVTNPPLESFDHVESSPSTPTSDNAGFDFQEQKVEEQVGVRPDVWVSGFFDKGSFTELLAGWASAVVVGRARLGGMPVGVIITENRTTQRTVPPDPATPDSKEEIVHSAGQVWFPDSAYKTAQAIQDLQAEDLPLIIFANWRGFSGGQRDMYNEILKFGSYIVDRLQEYRQPVFVYIPPKATLRGGAWVVLDSTINREYIEMYTDEDSRAGILEPSGTVGVKFRKADIVATCHRLDDKLKALDQELRSIEAGDAKNGRSQEAVLSDIADREKAIFSIYHQVATSFCDLHDTPGRMLRKGVIRQVLKWEQSRRFFYWRVRRRLVESQITNNIESISSSSSAAEVLQSWLGESKVYADDEGFVQWAEQNGASIEKNLAFLKSQSLASGFKDLVAQLQSHDANAMASSLADILKTLPADVRASVLGAI